MRAVRLPGQTRGEAEMKKEERPRHTYTERETWSQRRSIQVLFMTQTHGMRGVDSRRWRQRVPELGYKAV